MNPNLSGWWYTYPSKKYDLVSWDDEIFNIWKNKKCSKPPTSCGFIAMVPTYIDFKQFFKPHQSQESLPEWASQQQNTANPQPVRLTYCDS
jgi:hypothetical protein